MIGYRSPQNCRWADALSARGRKKGHPVPPLSWTPEGLLNYCPEKSGAL